MVKVKQGKAFLVSVICLVWNILEKVFYGFALLIFDFCIMEGKIGLMLFSTKPYTQYTNKETLCVG